MASKQDFLNAVAAVKQAATDTLTRAVSDLQARVQANAYPDQAVADLQDTARAINAVANQINNVLAE